jgi:hypothetical protein
VRLRAIPAGEPFVDAAADDRVNELQGKARFEDPGLNQSICGVRRLRRLELRQARGVDQIALLEYGQRPRQANRGIRQTAEPELDRAPDGARADPLDLASSPCRRSDPALAQCLQQLAQQKRRSARRAQARVDEDRVRSLPERRLQQLRDRIPRERTESNDLGGRRGHEGRKQLRVDAHLARTSRREQRDAQLVEARDEERQVAQRGRVGPLGVVDHHA